MYIFFLCTFFCVHFFSLEYASLNTSFSFHFLFTYQLAAHSHSASPPSCLEKLWRSQTHNPTFLEQMTWKPPLSCQNSQLYHRHQLKRFYPRPALFNLVKEALKNPIKIAPWSQKWKTAEDYAKDRMGKYAQYFEKDRILSIPELVQAVGQKNLSFVISDLRTRRSVRLKKETMEELLKTAGVPRRYFCRRSFAT